MDIERIKVKQAALQAHSSLQDDLSSIVHMFRDGEPALTKAIVQGFASLGLQASVDWGFWAHEDSTPNARVVVPGSTVSIKIEVWSFLEFDEKKLRSVFRYTHYTEDATRILVVEPQMPMALPIVITRNSIGKFSTWWHGPGENERLAAIVRDVFKDVRGPDDLGIRRVSRCFVATAVFGDGSEEVAVLRRWRDQRLAQSVGGRAFINVYYALGPFCAAVVRGSGVVRLIVRGVLRVVCRHLSESQSGQDLR